MELAFLEPLLDRPGPWASVVVDTSRGTEDAAKQNELRRRAATRELTGLGADPRTVEAVARWLAAEPVSGSPAGRAIFATDGKVALDLALDCAPLTVETSWSVLPRVAPLLSICGEHPDLLLARIDRTGADLELCDGLGRRHVAAAQGPQWRGRGHRSVPTDRYEWHYQHRVEDTWEKTAQMIADEVTAQLASSPVHLVVLAGDARERHEVRRRLPKALDAAIVELPTGVRAPGGSDEALDAELAQVRARVAVERTEEALAGLAAGRARDPGTGHARSAGSAGRTVEGVPRVVAAARDRQLATLLLDPTAPDTARIVWTGPEPCQLAADRGEVRALGVAHPRPARADDALLRAATSQHAEALTVAAASTEPIGGVGALLRWPRPAAAA